MMNAPHEIGERLSAYLDGELDGAEIDALLDSLDNPACRAQLTRFSSTRSTGSSGAVHNVDISARVRAQIQAEQPAPAAKPVVLAAWRRLVRRGTSRRAQPAWWVSAAGLAVAAGVGAVTLNLAPVTQPAAVAVPERAAQTAEPASLLARSIAAPVMADGSGPQAQTVAAVRPAQADVPQATQGAGRELVIPAPDERRELDQLYLQHARFRGGYALAPPASLARAGAALTSLHSDPAAASAR